MKCQQPSNHLDKIRPCGSLTCLHSVVVQTHSLHAFFSLAATDVLIGLMLHNILNDIPVLSDRDLRED